MCCISTCVCHMCNGVCEGALKCIYVGNIKGCGGKHVCVLLGLYVQESPGKLWCVEVHTCNSAGHKNVDSVWFCYFVTLETLNNPLRYFLLIR